MRRACFHMPVNALLALVFVSTPVLANKNFTEETRCTRQDQRFFGLGMNMSFYYIGKQLCSLGGPSSEAVWTLYLKAHGCSKNDQIFDGLNHSFVAMDTMTWSENALRENPSLSEVVLEQSKQKVIQELGGCEKIQKFHSELLDAYRKGFPGAKQ